MFSLDRLRVHAISQSLFPPTTLRAAVRRLGFVQADPIRSPARAQDLILRQRVRGYCAGDLERQYARLDIEEDVLYAYGFLPRTIWQLLHPRKTGGISRLEKRVLEVVREFGPMHPRDMEGHFGESRVVNAWGGYSKATTHALDALHYRGLLKIARREKGIRIYEAAPPAQEPIEPGERLRKLIMVIAGILAPIRERMLSSTITRFKHLGDGRAAVRRLLKTGELEAQKIDNVTYLWPDGRSNHQEVPGTVRFLAPFDPLVWDRLRFEHFWGWRYRFEAYTPVAKRVRGYYAMPLLWRDAVIGWANTGPRKETGVDVQVGFVEKRPAEREFQLELDAEISRLRIFCNRGKT